MKVIHKEKTGRVRVSTVNDAPSLTQQQFKDQCDVNKIIAKYKTTGEWTHLTKKGGVYADVSSIKDYHQSLQKVLDANNAFAALPAQIRNRFQNDPAQLLAFLQDPKNHAEGVELGLFEKPKPPAPAPIKNELNESNNSAQPEPKKTP